MSQATESPVVAEAGFDDSYTVQQAAQLTGLSEHTLRYYERVGLLPPVRRHDSSRHRRYSASDIATIETLACLRAAGLPVEQMRRYFALIPRGRAAARQQRELLEEQRRVLEARLRQMEWNLKYIQRKIAYWRALEADDERKAAEIARELGGRIRGADG